MKRILKEFSRWERIVTDYRNAPGNGIRGKDLKRKSIYLQQDNDIQHLFEEFEQRAADPLRYLRTISHHLVAQ